jgi:hypothetical protein
MWPAKAGMNDAMLQSSTTPMHDRSNYDKFRHDAQTVYASTKPRISPALREQVFFTSEGFNHIVFTGARRERERSSQIMRFKLLPRAIRLVSHANTFQEYEETLKEFEVKARKKRQRQSKPVRYWGIIAIFEGRKIKVILRRIGNGQLHFWSVIPAWTTNKFRDARFISTMKGNPAED